ncbi:MAG: glycosyltransferase [Lentisphaeria bacterium]|nr:glycosyltransferase [Lentisphaeria bacterium]
MIFLTIGTHEPFDRLVRALDDWCDQNTGHHEIIAQVVSPATDAYRPRHFDTVAHLSPKDYEAHICTADLIVSHAGMGSILTAFTHGKPIVIMPRRGHLRETRNDHQYTTVSNLKARPGLFVAEDEAALPAVMDKALATIASAAPPCLSDVADPGFTTALREFILSSRQG